MGIKDAEIHVSNDYLNEYVPFFMYSQLIDTPKGKKFKENVNPLRKLRRIEEYYPNRPFYKKAVNSSKYLKTINGFTDVINKRLDEYNKTNDRKTLDKAFYLAEFLKNYIRKDF